MNGDIAVVDILTNDAAVGALVGGTGVNVARVFMAQAPQSQEYPLCIVDVFDNEPYDSKSGVASVDHDMVKVFCYAATMDEAVNLQDAVRTALDGTSGTHRGVVVEYIRYLRHDSYYVPATNRGVYVRELDFMVRVQT